MGTENQPAPILFDSSNHIWWWDGILGGWSDGKEVRSLEELDRKSGPLRDDDTGELFTWDDSVE